MSLITLLWPNHVQLAFGPLKLYTVRYREYNAYNAHTICPRNQIKSIMPNQNSAFNSSRMPHPLHLRATESMKI